MAYLRAVSHSILTTLSAIASLLDLLILISLLGYLYRMSSAIWTFLLAGSEARILYDLEVMSESNSCLTPFLKISLNASILPISSITKINCLLDSSIVLKSLSLRVINGMAIDSKDFKSTQYLPTFRPLLQSIRDNGFRFELSFMSITSKPILSPIARYHRKNNNN